jgi:hypothetical protein
MERVQGDKRKQMAIGLTNGDKRHVPQILASLQFTHEPSQQDEQSVGCVQKKEAASFLSTPHSGLPHFPSPHYPQKVSRYAPSFQTRKK